MLYVDDCIGNWTDKDIEYQSKSVSEQRREKIKSYKFALDQELCLKSYQLLQKGLKQEYNMLDPPIFTYAGKGKPSLAHYPQIHFNMSHCKKAISCIIARHPVGIDVEEITPFNPNFAQYVLNKHEYKDVKASNNPAIGFILLWTMKESLLKLTGEGLDPQILPTILQNSSEYKFKSLINSEKGYIVTTCSAK